MRTAKLILAGATLLLITGCKHQGPIDNTDIPNSVKLYAANSGDGTISVIDVSENEVTKTIPVGLKPAAIAVSTERKRAYVANFMSKSVSVIDTETDAVRNTIILPGHPIHLVAGDSMVYVIVDHDTTIGNDAYIAGVTLDEEVFVDSLYFDDACNSLKNLAYSQTGLLYAASEISPTCFTPIPRPFTVNTKSGKVLSGNSLSSRILKFAPDEKLLYIVGEDFWGVLEERIYTFDIGTGSLILDHQDIAVNGSLTTLVLSPNGQEAYLGDAMANHISVLDLNPFTFADSLTVNSPVQDMVVTKDEQFIYATHPTANQVSQVDIKSERIITEIAVGSAPKAIVLIPPT